MRDVCFVLKGLTNQSIRFVAREGRRSFLRSGYGKSVNVMDDKSDKQDFVLGPDLGRQLLTFAEEFDKTPKTICVDILIGEQFKNY